MIAFIIPFGVYVTITYTIIILALLENGDTEDAKNILSLLAVAITWPLWIATALILSWRS